MNRRDRVRRGCETAADDSKRGPGPKGLCLVEMKHTLYEDPVTHKFALIRLPLKFAEGDKIPVPSTARWFSTRDEAMAALPSLLNEEE